jgi:sulfate permease, SulP family
MSTPLQQSIAGSDQPAGDAHVSRFALQGILPLDRRRLPRDLLAGVTLAALAIPEVMGYTRIAGTPVVTGLYTLLLPALLFALFGSSRRLVVGADSATAAIMAAALVPLALPRSAAWMDYAVAMALACGVLLLVARIARLAFLADFLSRTVLAGFLTGVGLQVACGELPGMFGLEPHGRSTLSRLADFVRHAAELNAGDVAIAAGVIAFILVLRRVAPKWPGALIAALIAIAASRISGWGAHDIAVVGTVQGGLPHFSWPELSFAREHASELAPAVFAMVVVILAQSAATSRTYAWKYNEQVSEEQDMVGLALANAGAALTGSFVVNGSPTKTQMLDAAGGHSQVAHLTMAAVVAGVLLFATAAIAALPIAALSAIVFLIGIDLLHVAELRRVRSERPSEFWIALAAAGCVLVAGVELAIVLAMVLSLIDHVRRGYRPHNSVVVRGPDGHRRLEPVHEAGEYEPGLVVYRFSHSMYYANADVLSREVTTLSKSAAPGLRWFVIDLDAVDDIDYSAGATLRSLQRVLGEQGVALKFARGSPEVRALLHRYGLFGPGDDAAMGFASLREMRRAFEAASEVTASQSRGAQAGARGAADGS